MTKKPDYVYDRNGVWWYIYKMTYINESSYGEKISGSLTHDEAKEETYSLNGWDYEILT
jgi:hypothetical protein